MFQLTLDQLQSICISAQGRGRCAVFLPHINELAPAAGLDTPYRMAMFLCQIMHESGEFRYVRELGSHAYLAKYDTGRLAERLGNTPEDDGDGQFYRGRGLIQVTGASNYRACAEALKLPLMEHPELLEQPRWAVASALWFWQSRRLELLSDTGNVRDITRRVNGGLNGLAERRAYFWRACDALGIPPNQTNEAKHEKAD